MPRLSKIGAAALAAFGWTSGTSAVTANFLVIAGGGGGGRNYTSATYGGAGGGGAGGYRTSSGTSGGGASAESALSLNPTLSYTVIVGAGGAGSVSSGTNGANGFNSSISTITSTGGGGGGGAERTSGSNGGSGGGAPQISSTAGSGTANQGYSGGISPGANNDNSGSGGGGAGSVGGNTSSNVGGNGGSGVSSSITGTSVSRAGGGGGGGNGTGGTASAGGGAGGATSGQAGYSGTENYGGGGGGAAFGTPVGVGGNGGSGIVIISYAGAQQFSGGIVTSVGGNTIHTFTTSGTLGPITTLSASYLIVAGGAGAGWGGGGAGGLLSGSGVTIDPNSTYLVTVGAGGTGVIANASGAAGSNGGNSSFSMVATTAVGGGGGAGYGSNSTTRNGIAGGSGGGGSRNAGDGTGGAGTSGQGNAGGNGKEGAPYYGSGGGGGAGAAGAAGTTTAGGNGGVGVTSSISGTSTYYAGGGGGAVQSGGTQGTGGSGGGGNAQLANGISGTANLGGGGGGTSSGADSNYGGNGGSGVVIISYAGATQQMAGGTVTIVGGNVIHTFTNTGYLAPLKYSTGSVRFRQSNSAYLTRTPTVAGNRRTWTWSGWVKRGSLATGYIQGLFEANDPSSTTIVAGIRLETDNTLKILDYSGGYSTQVVTTQVFRDPSAWYHIVVAYDTTQATSSNRVKLYVNGTQVTSFSTATYPSQNSQGYINNTGGHYLGACIFTSVIEFLDGEMTEINFVDGSALTPSSFGTFNSYGVWQPITYGGSYGTNGYYLPFNRQGSSFVGSFNGSSQYLTVPSNSIYNQTGDFTIEYYAYFAANTNYQEVVARGTSFITIQHSSDANAMIRLVAYGTATIATGGNVVAQKWNHFAIVRSGSTVTGYVNGVAVCSGTYSNSITDTIPLSIGANGYGGSFTHYTNGYVSNVRYNNNAVYTSNFTPSTSPLTSSANTLLLTLQNSSIVDNSSTGATITNVGGVSTGQTYPFGWGIFNDQSPAGNNWTPTNISGAFGSTLDYLGDAPTLTSATVANTCVFGTPYSDMSVGSITDGGLSISTYTGNAQKRASFAVTSGKFYWEITVSGGVDPTAGAIGITDPSKPNNTGVFTTSGNGVIQYYGSGNKYVNGTNTAYGASYTSGDVIGVALDMDGATITFYKNNTSQGSISTSGTLTTAMPMLANGSGSQTTNFTANFGQQPFKYTPPSGFVALNTYNL